MDRHNRIPGHDLPDGYAELLEDLKSRIQTARVKAMLTVQIESMLYERHGKAVTNFDRTLPPLQSDLAIHASERGWRGEVFDTRIEADIKMPEMLREMAR